MVTPPVDDPFPVTTENYSVTIDVLANDYVVPVGLSGLSAEVNVTSASSSGDSGTDISFEDGSSYDIYAKQDSWEGTLGSEFTWTMSNLPFASFQDGGSFATTTWGGNSSGSNNQFSLFKNGVLVATASQVTYMTVTGKVLGSPGFKLEVGSIDATLESADGAVIAALIPPHSHVQMSFSQVDGLNDPGDPPPVLEGTGALTVTDADRYGFTIDSWQTNDETHGTVDWNSDHSQLVFTPETDYSWYVDSGEPQPWFTYQIAFAGEIIPFAATVLVNVQNVRPRAQDDIHQPPPAAIRTRWEAVEGEFVDINFLANDNPGQGREWAPTPLSSFPAAPAHGTVGYIPGTKSIRYQASGNYSGPDKFQYEVENDQGQFARAWVYVYVTPVNDPPVMRTPNNIWEMALGASADAVVARAIADDPDLNESLTYQIVGGTDTGLFKVDARGFISLTRTLTGAIGDEYTLQVRATDRAGISSAPVTHTMRVVANPAERAPSIEVKDEIQTVYMDKPKPVTFTAIEGGAPSSTLMVSVDTLGAQIVDGDPDITRSGNTFTITYALIPGETGSFVFNITVTDDDGQSNSKTATISVVDPLDLVDWNFTSDKEGGRRTTAYFPYFTIEDANNVKKGAGSGVTIATGFDFGGNSAASIRQLIPGDVALQDKLINSGYLGLRGGDAFNFVNDPAHIKLVLTDAECETLELAKRRQVVNAIIAQYDPAAEANGLKGFWSIPRGVATAIFDRWWWAGSISPQYHYWQYIAQQDWGSAAYELRHWRNGQLNALEGEYASESRRLNAEAQLIAPQ